MSRRLRDAFLCYCTIEALSLYQTASKQPFPDHWSWITAPSILQQELACVATVYCAWTFQWSMMAATALGTGLSEPKVCILARLSEISD